MQSSRLTKVILLWDQKFSELNSQYTTWSSEVREVFQNYGLEYFLDNLNLFPLKETIGTLRSRMKIRQMGELRVKCGNKPQLRNYVLHNKARNSHKPRLGEYAIPYIWYRTQWLFFWGESVIVFFFIYRFSFFVFVFLILIFVFVFVFHFLFFIFHFSFFIFRFSFFI